MKKKTRNRNPLEAFVLEARKEVRQREKELSEIRSRKRNKSRGMER